MKKRILVLVVAVWICLDLVSCGGGKRGGPPSGLTNRVLAAQGVSATLTFGGLFVINGLNDTIAPVAPLNGGHPSSLMVLSPSRNIVAALDPIANIVSAVNTTTESLVGNVQLPGPTNSIVIPTTSPTGFAAVPSATVNGFTFQGAVELLNFTSGSLQTIAVPNVQEVFSNSTGTQLLAFSADSDSVTVLSPGAAAPPVDTSCVNPPSNNPPPNAVCTIITDGFSRPVFAIENGNTAYILNCGFQCGGTVNGQPAPASVAVFDLGSLTITQTIPVDGATMAFLSGSTLYVAGTPVNPATPTSNGLCPSSQNTAATNCGVLDLVDLGSMQVTTSAIITDGFHDRMDMTANGQLFIGSKGCTNIGNANNPSGEVRGCLSIYRTADGSVLIPPDNGDVGGLQSFTTRNIEYVAQGGLLRVYDTTKDILLINDFLPQGTINVVGYIGDVKAIDFF